ncbi:MAG: DEAD/DEAH box helicase [Deltaproteobacteria bacterium]|nr:DEAD/DEAH box helicase [Deltaproteobacteria bacterium]
MTDAVDSQTSGQRAPAPTFLTQTRFSDFDLHPSLLQGLDDSGFTRCTPIQAETLPISLAGRDVAGQAQTGTGKTAAFMVTVLQRLTVEPRPEDGSPRALVVAPTRELAQQTYEEALNIGRHLDLKVVQVVGGIDYDKQAEALKNGVDIVVGTPGRVIDYIKQGIFNTKWIRIVVIDEADRLFDLGFTQDMRFILRKLPSYEKRQSMLFSATLSYRVLELTYEYMNLPEFISVTPQDVAVEGIAQELFHVGEEQKLPLLLGLLQREKWERVLIFVNTKVGVEWLTRKLKGNGLPAEMITGDLPQKKRFQLMDRYKSGKIKILVATDVASRGIHVEDISHVINYDLPQDAENYVHRIGRTARAGKQGKAISLACERYVLHLEPVENMLGYKIPVIWPEDDWYVEDKAGPVKVASRIRDKRNGRGKPSRGGEGRKNGPAGPRVREKSQPKPIPKRPPDYFPGTFFGFAPPEPEPQPENEAPAAAVPAPEAKAAPAAKSETPPAAQPAEAAPATENPKPKKRRRRPRRRRKKPENGAESPSETATDSTPAAD